MNHRIEHWLRLAHHPKISLGWVYAALQRSASPQQFMDYLLDNAWMEAPFPQLRRALASTVKENKIAVTSRYLTLSIECEEYPALLRQIPTPPLVLYLLGQAATLKKNQIAVVGSRQPSSEGLNNARSFARQLAQRDWAITSGLARGIDLAAHLGCLEGGAPTLAVMGCGLNHLYPAAHRQYARRILDQGGCLVSEFAPDMPPRKENFPRRNRIISGMARGTLVVEASLRSGSLITARHAAEQGRDVFAIPSSIHNPLARGCHQLIRQGAKLVESVQDICEEWSDVQRPALATVPGESLPAPGKTLLDLLNFAPMSVDTLIESSRLEPEVVISQLLALELQDLVLITASGLYARVG